MAWDPSLYLSFADHRLRPALDLLGRVPADAPARVVDLGCGAGNVTRVLRQRWPAAAIVGIDGSPEMLARAEREGEGLRLNWLEADIAGWATDEPVDLLYSNAALHWLGGHETLFPRLIEMVAPGGWLAVQMPRNFTEPSHTSMAEAARSGPWRRKLEPLLKPAPVAEPAFYHRLLAPFSAGLDLWETVYWQRLTGENPVADWTKSTWLSPLLAALEPGAEREGFEAAYRGLIAAAYPKESDGSTLFPFRRLFLVAQKGA